MDDSTSNGYAQTAQKALLEALAADQPHLALQRVMVGMLERGLERDDVLSILDATSQDLVRAGRDHDAALLLELLDGLDGWCRI